MASTIVRPVEVRRLTNHFYIRRLCHPSVAWGCNRVLRLPHFLAKPLPFNSCHLQRQGQNLLVLDSYSPH